MHHAADVRHVPIHVGVRRSVRGWRTITLNKFTVEVADNHRLRGKLVVGHARRFDDEEIATVRHSDALGDISRSPHD
jgi:hypothetical protein